MKGRKGSALVTVLLTFTVLSILAVALIAVITARMRMTASYEDSTETHYAAEAGIEQMKVYIGNQVNACRTSVQSQVDSYVNSEDYDPDTDLNQYADSLADAFFGSHLNNHSETGSFSEVDTGFTATAAYNAGNNTVTVNSKATHGHGAKATTRTVTVKYRLNSISEPFDVPGSGSGMPPYPLIVNGPAVDPYSLKTACGSFEVNGNVYLKTSLDTTYVNASSLTFDNDVVINADTTIETNLQQVTVKGNMKVNGDLELGPTYVQLKVGGDLIVNGDIILNGFLDSIDVGGNVRCNGNILIDWGGSLSTFTVHKNLYLHGSYTNRPMVAGLDVKGYTYKGQYGGSIETVNFVFGTDTGVFKDAQKGNTINRSAGTDTQPVIIFNKGDIDINLANGRNIVINGIIYATGRVNVKGNAGSLTINGCVVSGEKINIESGSSRAFFNYSDSIIGLLKDRYSSMIAYFSAGGSESSTVNVGIVSGFTSTSWDE